MASLGDFDASTVVYGKFTTFRPSTGASYTLGGTPALSVYKDNSTTQSTTGVTLTADFDSVTGLNHFAIDTSADGTFYSAGSFFDIVITAGTVDSISVVGAVVASFTIRKNSALKPATAGRTLVVDAAGLADANTVKVGPTGSGTAQTAKDIGGAVPAAAAGASGGLLISGSNAGTTTLAALTVTGSFTISDGLLVSRSTSNTSAITATGNGTGHGISAASGSGATGNAINAAAASTNGNGFNLAGTGTGSGIQTTGGATGYGLRAVGGSTSGHGIQTSAPSSGSGIYSAGAGNSNAGIVCYGSSATGAGLELNGGSASGDGMLVRATSGHGISTTGAGSGKVGIVATGGTNAAGMSLAGAGTGAGLLTTGGATGIGLSVVGGATSGDGIKSVTTSGHGINLAPVGTNMHGLFATGGNGGTSDGIKAAAGTGGVDFRANRTGDLTGNVSGSVGSVTGLTASNLDATISSRMATYTQPTGFLAATFPAAVASTTNITAGTLTTVTTATNVTTVNGLASGVITAASIAADAITAAKIADGAIDAATFAAGAINAAAIAADAITDAKVASDVTIASVTGAVGSVTGNVGGNVTGSVGSVATGGIVAASFGAGAIDAAAIATDAIGSAELASTAVAEIAGAVWDIAIASHLTSGTTGAALNAAGGAGDPWITSLPGSYSAGQAGYILGTNLNATVSSRATQTSVDTVDDFLDTEVGAIKAKTDQLVFSAGNLLADLRAIAAAPVAVDTGTAGTISFISGEYVATSGGTVSANVVQIDGENVANDGNGRIRIDWAESAAASGVRNAIGMASGNLDTQLGAIAVTSAAADTRGDLTVARGTVGSSSTTTSIVTSAFSPAGAVADQFKGRIVIFDKTTATAALRGQATDITASSSSSTPTLTVTALTTAPASSDTFSVV